jgi:hypothetical protein
MKVILIFFVLLLNNLAAYSFEDELLIKYFSLPKDKVLLYYYYDVSNHGFESKSNSWHFLIDENFDTIINFYSFVLNLKEKKDLHYFKNSKRLMFSDPENNRTVSVLFEKSVVMEMTLVKIDIFTRVDAGKKIGNNEDESKSMDSLKQNSEIDKNKIKTADELKEIQKQSKLAKEKADIEIKELVNKYKDISKQIEASNVGKKTKVEDNIIKQNELKELEKKLLLSKIEYYNLILRLNNESRLSGEKSVKEPNK